jgi:hypothetical protein
MDNQFRHEMATYIQSSQDLTDSLAKENKALLQKNATLSKALRVQKEASQQSIPSQVLAPEQIADLADSMVRARFIKEAARDSFIGAAMHNPLEIVGFLSNLADITIKTNGLPILGSSVQKEASVTANKGQSASDASWENSIRRLSSKLKA